MHYEIKYSDFVKGEFTTPYNWVHCLNENCEIKKRCTRWHVIRKMKQKDLWEKCILPTSNPVEGCILFQEMKVIKVAWGFKKALSNVKACDYKAIRHDIIKTMSNRRDFSRYDSGTWKLTENQQEKIKRIFADYGYDDMEFDFYEEMVSFLNE